MNLKYVLFTMLLISIILCQEKEYSTDVNDSDIKDANKVRAQKNNDQIELTKADKNFVNNNFSRGQILTSRNESEDPDASRSFYVLDKNSGVTIGYGYDMKDKSAKIIETDFRAIGVEQDYIDIAKEAAGLKDEDAREFIRKNKIQLTRKQQDKLFKRLYQRKLEHAKYLVTRKDVVQIYGEINWEEIDPAIKEVLVDIVYDNDYGVKQMARIQNHIVENDFAKLADEIGRGDLGIEGKRARYIVDHLRNYGSKSYTELRKAQKAFKKQESDFKEREKFLKTREAELDAREKELFDLENLFIDRDSTKSDLELRDKLKKLKERRDNYRERKELSEYYKQKKLKERQDNAKDRKELNELEKQQKEGQ